LTHFFIISIILLGEMQVVITCISSNQKASVRKIVSQNQDGVIGHMTPLTYCIFFNKYLDIYAI